MKLLQRYREVEPYTTRDGSEIRELMHPQVQGNTAQSLAEATVFPGQQTLLHRHAVSEEIYHVIAGQGRMTLAGEEFDISVGDTVCIAPGTAHRLLCLGSQPLRVLCACSPAYSHADTDLLE